MIRTRRFQTAAWHRIAVLAWFLISGIGVCQGSETSDQAANALLEAMKSQQYDAAFGMFDSTLKAAVPVEKLRTLWAGQLATLGNLTSWSLTQRDQVQGRDLRVALLQFEHGRLQASIFVNPTSHDVGGFFIRPYTPPAAPAAYVDSTKFHTLEVNVGADPFLLGGTLALPNGAGPFPGVVLVHGSGPNDRDESVGGNKIFKDLAEGLASRGIAVLRYDKRTYRYGPKLGRLISVDDEVTLDAIAAMKLLAARPEVDGARLFVAGHSMGAALAPEIAIRSGVAAGAVLLAPPGRAPWELVLSQMRYLGAPKEQIDDVENKVALLKQGKVENQTLLGAPLSYWKELAAHDGVATAAKFGKPILVLRGERDYQVLDEDVAAWRRGLAGVAQVAIETIPGGNHLFIDGSGKSGPAEYSVPGHVDARVIDRLVSFIAPPRAGAR